MPNARANTSPENDVRVVDDDIADALRERPSTRHALRR